MMKSVSYILFVIVFLFSSCRGDEIIVTSESEKTDVIPDINSNPYGFYLLNEGNMGSNKASLDFMDYRTGTYQRNIYAERNPNVVKELGDVGNEVRIYRDKLYVVVNASHKVEVLDAVTGVSIKHIDIPNCRSLAFDDENAYVSSYVAPIGVDTDVKEGAVYRIDINSLQITGNVKVGYQPEEMVAKNGFLYVANSGGYRLPDYDNTISTIRLSDFEQIKKTPVAINLSLLREDKYGKLWLLSRGNYKDIPSILYRLTVATSGDITAIENTGIPCSNFAIGGDKLYLYNTQWVNNTPSDEIAYRVVDVLQGVVINESFISDGTASNIKVPYGITVNPSTGDVIICDAKNYVSSGTINSYSP
ncbi:MAG: YncE family protein, partial [Bacteroidales bacterium]